jgi:SAM-dependent methyltransferase
LTAQTWHHGVVSHYWAEFNRSGPEIDYFRRFVEAGQPALDVACGTGRLLVPYLREGLDVDGCDVSPDMLSRCREAAEREGLSPTLHAQAAHELDVPRRYRTIFMCGGFGLGSTRDQDLEALRRFHAHLEPGGRLVLDNEVPYSNEHRWQYWLKDVRRTLPRPWPAEGERRTGADGTEYELRARTASFDPLDQRLAMDMRARMWREGELVADEQHVLTMRSYFRDEIVLMLERAGFSGVEVRGQYDDRPPSPDDDFLVYLARRGEEDAAAGAC